MTVDEESRVKGRILKAYGKYIKKRWGLDGLAACSKVVGEDIMSVQDEQWVPNAYQTYILDWMGEAHGEDAVRQAGTSIVAERGVLSYVARVAGFERVLDRGIEEIRESIRPAEVRIRKDGKKATIEMRGLSESVNACIAWQGVFEGALQITKTKGTVTRAKCIHKGDDVCTYEVVWQ